MDRVSEMYIDAAKIRVVQDNLNTHNAGSFYERFDPEKARYLKNRFEFHYTPKKGSWLNMAEIELSSLARQCLDRRIGDEETLEREAKAWEEKRNQKKVKVNWRFTTNDARTKMKRHYPIQN
jgi:recombinational DNA repair ATPase RecF